MDRLTRMFTTHTELYLPFDSHHPMGTKKAVFGALARRLTYVTREDDREEELTYIQTVLMDNGYARAKVEASSKQSREERTADQEELLGTVCIPYVKGMSEAIGRILKKVQIRVVHKPKNWKWKLMAGVKDPVDEVNQAGVVYALECNDCERRYLGETGRSLRASVKEHVVHARNGRTDLSAMAEPAWSGHKMNWTPKVLASEKTTKERRVREALEIHARSRIAPTLNRDKGVELSKLWLDLV